MGIPKKRIISESRAEKKNFLNKMTFHLTKL